MRSDGVVHWVQVPLPRQGALLPALPLRVLGRDPLLSLEPGLALLQTPQHRAAGRRAAARASAFVS